MDISFETKNATAKVRFEAVFTYQVWVTIADAGQIKVKEMPLTKTTKNLILLLLLYLDSLEKVLIKPI